jgi:hypothetical protein
MFLNDFDMLILKIYIFFNISIIKNYLVLVSHKNVELIIYKELWTSIIIIFLI